MKRIAKTRVEKGSLIVSERVKVVVWRRESDAGESPLSLASLPARRSLARIHIIFVQNDRDPSSKQIASRFWNFVRDEISFEKILQRIFVARLAPERHNGTGAIGCVETATSRLPQWEGTKNSHENSVWPKKKSILNTWPLLKKKTDKSIIYLDRVYCRE